VLKGFLTFKHHLGESSSASEAGIFPRAVGVAADDFFHSGSAVSVLFS
jgi:hypothetical protein